MRAVYGQGKMQRPPHLLLQRRLLTVAALLVVGVLLSNRLQLSAQATDKGAGCSLFVLCLTEARPRLIQLRLDATVLRTVPLCHLLQTLNLSLQGGGRGDGSPCKRKSL